MEMTANGTVESILLQVDNVSVGSHNHFELWVPQSLTLRGQTVPLNLAMAIILDKILAKQFVPDGFIQKETGRVYRYKPMKN